MKASLNPLRFAVIFTFLFAFTLLDAPDVKAQYFSFGKNRVQYKDFDWRYIQSEHFDVYYYTSKNYDLAAFSALVLEASLKQLHEDFEHQIVDRIEVIIYDSHNDFSETNVVALPTTAEGIGGVTDAFKNRITMPFDGDYDKFRGVLTHELVHAVINDMFYGGSVQSRLSGNALQIPLWFNEGLSEYEANAYDTETGLYIRDGIVNDYLPPIPRLGGFLAYRGGQSLWNFIVEEYGRNKIGEIMQTLKQTRNIQAAFQRTLGLNVQELSERWQDYYEKIYAPEVAEREDIDDFGEAITEGGINTSPSFSPQGDKIAILKAGRGLVVDLIVINAITGEKIKTLIKGNENINFEEFNLLQPNLTWSPDGTKIALSAKSEGKDQLAIVNYQSGKKRYIEFPNLDAIGSVAWSPDGTKIAFDGNIGPYQDIFVYDLENNILSNLTNDAITDVEPTWGPDSETIYFVSGRGAKVELDKYKNSTELLLTNAMYTKDLYSVKPGDSRAQRLTSTPLWNENQPETTRDGRLIFISDENGISNIYELNLEDRTTAPLTNLLTGAQQISLSADGSRLAVSSLREGRTNIFTVSAPFSRKKEGRLKDNDWANRRAEEPIEQRVPAIDYVKELARDKKFVRVDSSAPGNLAFGIDPDEYGPVRGELQDSVTAARQDTVPADTVEADETDSENIDFRNYVFDSEVEEDSVFAAQYLDDDVFAVEDNTTENERYIPNDYRLKFSTDFIVASGGFSTFNGTQGLAQIRISDLLGDHQIIFGSSLQLDLRNSDYVVQYGNFKNRVNWLFSLSHQAFSFQNFGGQGFRFRNLSGGVTAQYPINKFERLDVSLQGISVSRDVSFFGIDSTQNDNDSFFYPQLTYTRDKTVPGFIVPSGGSRFAVGISGSPPITGETLQFASALGDFRKYFGLGNRYSFAVRGSGGVSFGRDSQTFYLGGIQGWINRQFADNVDPFEQFSDSFLAQPGIPLRGHEFFEITGDRFALANAEFRFPLFAALLPGPIPILPLYNLTGVAFVDAGTAFGQDIDFTLPGTNQVYFTNDGDFDFAVREENTIVQEFVDPNGNQQQIELPAPEGDILIGAGFGLRTIVFGLPLRYDVGWPYFRDGFDGNPTHYISIGVDF